MCASDKKSFGSIVPGERLDNRAKLANSILSLDTPEKILNFCANLRVLNSFQLCTKV